MGQCDTGLFHFSGILSKAQQWNIQLQKLKLSWIEIAIREKKNNGFSSEIFKLNETKLVEWICRCFQGLWSTLAKTTLNTYLMGGQLFLQKFQWVFLGGTHPGGRDAYSEQTLKRISTAGTENNLICSSGIGLFPFLVGFELSLSWIKFAWRPNLKSVCPQSE